MQRINNTTQPPPTSTTKVIVTGEAVEMSPLLRDAGLPLPDGFSLTLPASSRDYRHALAFILQTAVGDVQTAPIAVRLWLWH